MQPAATQRRARATYQHCARVAAHAGLRLVRRSEVHFALFGPSVRRWLLNIYPADSQCVSAHTGHQSPRLDLPEDWSLEDVVNAAVKAEKGAR